MLMSNTITHNEKLKELENQFCLTEEFQIYLLEAFDNEEYIVYVECGNFRPSNV